MILPSSRSKQCYQDRPGLRLKTMLDHHRRSTVATKAPAVRRASDQTFVVTARRLQETLASCGKARKAVPSRQSPSAPSSGPAQISVLESKLSPLIVAVACQHREGGRLNGSVQLLSSSQYLPKMSSRQGSRGWVNDLRRPRPGQRPASESCSARHRLIRIAGKTAAGLELDPPVGLFAKNPGYDQK